MCLPLFEFNGLDTKMLCLCEVILISGYKGCIRLLISGYICMHTMMQLLQILRKTILSAEAITIPTVHLDP